jgi:dihydroflavonol-4-reductase
MNVLITGATGFIGGNILKYLSEEGHFCRCLVRECTRVEGLQKSPNVAWFPGDLAKRETLAGICNGIDVVIHCAGELGRWNTTIEDLYPVNVMGIVNLSDEMIRNKVGFVIHVSAGGVTGPVEGGRADETYCCHPKTPYEKTKYQGEKNAFMLYEKYHVPLAVIRPTFTYGPADPHKLALFRTIRKGRFVLLGSGESTVHPLYIGDLLTGIRRVLEKRPAGELFIIGGPRAVTKKELACTIAEALGVKSRFFHVPTGLAAIAAQLSVLLAQFFSFEPILTPSRVSMMTNDWGYSIQKARNALGYEPAVNLKEGIRRTVKSYRETGWL